MAKNSPLFEGDGLSLFSRIIQMSKPSARPSSLVAGMSSLTVKLGLVLFFLRTLFFLIFVLLPIVTFYSFSSFFFPLPCHLTFHIQKSISITICQEEQKASSQAVIITIRIISGP